MRAKMGAYGLNPRDLALIVSIKDYNALLVQDEISRADSFGSGYTFGSGTLSQIFGIDVVPSARMRTDLTAGGVNAAAASTLGAAALIHVPSWFVGVKRGFTVETDQDKVAQVNQVIASFRRDFKPVFAPSSANGFHSVTMKNIL
jgi:hypothetical protein